MNLKDQNVFQQGQYDFRLDFFRIPEQKVTIDYRLALHPSN